MCVNASRYPSDDLNEGFKLVSLEVDWIKFTFTLLSLILLFISFVLSHALC